LVGGRVGAWLLGLAALLGFILVGRVNPMAYLLLSTWLPVPLLLAEWRLGLGAAVALAVAGVVAVMALTPGLDALKDQGGLFLLLFMGLGLSFWRSRGLNAAAGILLTVLAVALVHLGLFLAQAYFQGVSPWALGEQKSREVAQAITGMFAEAGMADQDFQIMGISRAVLPEVLRQVTPALLLINAGLVAWLNVLATRQLAGRWAWGGEGEPLSQWVCPEWFIFLFLAGGAGLLLPLAWVRQVGLNLLLALGFVYFCQGLAIIAALYQRFQVPRLLRLPGYLLAFLNPLMIAVMILGILDLWVDFRRLRSPREA